MHATNTRPTNAPDRLLKTTEDGSHTLYVPALDECYHSTRGAMQESNHIFIEAGLNQCSKSAINVLEIGLGTGLNALLTAVNCASSHRALTGAKTVCYTAIEAYPLSVKEAMLLNYPELIHAANYADDRSVFSPNTLRELFEKIHHADWERPVKISDSFTLSKLHADFTTLTLRETFDLIYFDAFSPEKQPAMWHQEIFEKLYLCAADDAILTTYCAKGAVRRALQTAGFEVERIPGPPGKREMLRAVKRR